MSSTRHPIRAALTRHAGFGAGTVALIVALLATYATEAWWMDRLARDVGSAQTTAVESALATIRQDFDRRVEAVQHRAQRLARQPAVVDGLQAHAARGRAEALTRFMARQQLPPRTAIEVYSPDGQLLAWHGPSMPPRRVPAPDTLSPGHTTVVRDGDVRWALAAWWPVDRAGPRAGAVRVVHLIRFQAPVQNQFIEDYSLERQWRIQTGYAVNVTWGAAAARAGPEGALRAGQRTLGHVEVQTPTAARLMRDARRWFANLAAGWQSLLMLWLVGGLWRGYRRLDASGGTARTRWQAVWRFGAAAAAWWGLRYALIAMDVPDRWQTGKAPLAPLFDPTHLASPIGGGLMESAGDLLITALFASVFTVGFLDLAARFRVRADSLSELWGQIRITTAPRPSPARFLAVLVAMALIELGLVYGMARLARRAVLDSTLDYFARTGLLPEPLVLVVLCSLLLITVAVVLCGAGTFWVALHALGRYRPRGWAAQQLVAAGGLVMGGVLATAAAVVPPAHAVAVPVVVAYWGVMLGAALLGLIQGGTAVKHLTLRSLLPGLILLTTLLYPVLYQGMDDQRRGRMVDATASFAEGSDPRVTFSLEQLLRRAQQSMARTVQDPAHPRWASTVDSIATELLQGSLLASLSQYEAQLVIFDSTGTAQRRFTTRGRRALPSPREREVFDRLRMQYALPVREDPVVRRLGGRPSQNRLQYAGLVAVEDSSGAPLGWILAQADPRSLLPGTGTPYPRVLLPEGLYGPLFADLTLAAFRDGVLARSIGDVGRAQLPRDVQQALTEQPAVWQQESFEGRRYLAYYRSSAAPDRVLAARMPAILAFDHLYYLLRLAIAGFCIGGPLYLLGVYLRYRRGMLPAARVRFRDKMLDAFLVVGSIAVLAVGIVGARVIVQENKQAVRNQLQQHLDRVEETLLVEARRGERLYRTVERLPIDSLARRVGLDLNLYADGRLVASSRPRLVRDRLIDTRLPAAAYQALHMDAYRFATTEEQFGAFTYTVGFQAVPDTSGQPRYVLAVPTLPEQERIQEEQARTLAYLLGALLLLIIVIMVTALFLANALAQPIARLRAGLEAVGEGRYAQRLPVDTRDEIGELVQTFNEMREQLAQSRRQLARQERELAWREMARQVAHEIKNPLTPMKLSVQHMRRAFQRLRVPASDGPAANGADQQFADLFDRITSTLIEQIDTLARIANEFSSFARLPERVVEALDLNEVIREAVALMQEEVEAAIELHLYDDPLVVRADRDELRRIYINLLKNALQAVPTHRTARIRVATAPNAASLDDATRAQSWVSDNGVGIPAGQRDKIFDPNFSTKTSGTGLGLAIAHKTIRELEGDIGFHTQEGEGTTFWIHLPLAE